MTAEEMLILRAAALGIAALATLHAAEAGAPLSTVLRLGRRASKAHGRLRAALGWASAPRAREGPECPQASHLPRDLKGSRE